MLNKEAIFMKKVLALCTVVLLPTVLLAWPPVGTQAPEVSLPDTAGVYHNIISEHHGRVIQLFFWQST